jgi:AcrR family transcriptional regulator
MNPSEPALATYALEPLPDVSPRSGGAGKQPGPARRERKKRQLRDALIHAALELFQAKGYEHTTVREITDTVDVSERTFFRYFASKEDLVLSFLKDRMDMLLRALAARPPAEEPLTAVRNAFRDSLREKTPDGLPCDDRPPYLSVVRLIEASPALLAAHLRYMHDHDDELVGVLARREGVDPATDRRPRLLAAMFGALVFLADREWRDQGSAGPEVMVAAFDAYAGQLAAALTGHWNDDQQAIRPGTSDRNRTAAQER